MFEELGLELELDVLTIRTKGSERERGKKRAREQKGRQAPVQTAGFGKAPRDRTAVRGGNVSRTFRG